MFKEFEKTLLNLNNIGCIKIEETTDKYSTHSFQIIIISLSGDKVCSYKYNTQKECEEKFELLKNILEKK